MKLGRSLSDLAIMHKMTPTGPRTHSGEGRITRYPREGMYIGGG
jgi:hypothetical protein